MEIKNTLLVVSVAAVLTFAGCNWFKSTEVVEAPKTEVAEEVVVAEDAVEATHASEEVKSEDAALSELSEK